MYLIEQFNPHFDVVMTQKSPLEKISLSTRDDILRGPSRKIDSQGSLREIVRAKRAQQAYIAYFARWNHSLLWILS